MPTRSAVARFLPMPENRSALLALQGVLNGLTAGACETLPNPVYLHGPSGSGKSFLIDMIADEVVRLGMTLCRWSANDFAEGVDAEFGGDADLLVVEDMQHFPPRFAPALAALIDERVSRAGPMVFTALVGPGRLSHRGTLMPRRLSTRLAAGLVVRMEPMQSDSRRQLLERLANSAKLTLAPEVLAWLTLHLKGGARVLEGAVRQLKTLQSLRKKPLPLAEIRAHFQPQTDATAPTVERIAAHVSSYFHVPPRQLASPRRSHDVLLPRQVSMFLARKLTNLSLEAIGKSLGGRDHKTVQHACKKVEQAMKSDPEFSGTVRQIWAELG